MSSMSSIRAAAAARNALSIQRKKLAPLEGDWRLPGVSDVVVSRTRHGGNGRPSLCVRKKQFIELESEEEEEEEEMEDEEEEEDDDEVYPEEDPDGCDDDDSPKKPEASRVLIETEALSEGFEKNCRCSNCGGRVSFTLKSLCLATSFTIQCKKKGCGYIYNSKACAAASIGYFEKRRERSTDYAVNVLFVLGFLSCGDGGTEAARLLGLLGMPNDTTMETRSFGIIEERISEQVQALSHEILHENLCEEIRLTIGETNVFTLWKQAHEGTIVLDKNMYPKIRCSYDMAWQQRNSGNRYASASGHALFVGACTRKPIALMVKSKLCNFCRTWLRKHPDEDDDEEIPEHECQKNHVGSSGSMEPTSCLEMVIDLFDNKFVVVQQICADDDSSTRALLKWSNEDYRKNTNTNEAPTVPISKGPNKGQPQSRPDRGRLPGHIPEPTFVADPNHRKKLVTGELYAIMKLKVKERATMTKMDCTRVGKNFGYMIRSLKTLPETEYVTAGKAVLEHHFDEHTLCGAWCPRKRMTAQQRQESERYYRTKKNDPELYEMLNRKLGRFFEFERLQECAHGMDTQVNESFNNTISWFAPKNKVYCGSTSLRNRISVAVGINTLGYVDYFVRLLKNMGIATTDNVRHFLEYKEKVRAKRLESLKTRKVKKKRLQRKFDQLKQDEADTKIAAQKRNGVYQSGYHLKDNADDEDNDGQQQQQQKRPRKNNSIPAKDRLCPHCNKKGHSTTRSMQCLKNPKNMNDMTAAPAADNNVTDEDNNLLDPADDVDMYETLPLEMLLGASRSDASDDNSLGGDDEVEVRPVI
jgi:hypothetical protein